MLKCSRGSERLSPKLRMIANMLASFIPNDWPPCQQKIAKMNKNTELEGKGASKYCSFEQL